MTVNDKSIHEIQISFLHNGEEHGGALRLDDEGYYTDQILRLKFEDIDEMVKFFDYIKIMKKSIKKYCKENHMVRS